MKYTFNSNCPALKVAVVLFAASALFACQKDIPVSATDPYPFPDSYTACKDNSVEPGDSFFDYCNGTWLAAHPVPSDPAKVIGGMYEGEGAMAARVEQLKAEVPDIGRFFYLMDHVHGTPEQAHAYIDAQKAKYTKPQSLEDAYRTIGKMYMDGVNVLGISIVFIWEKSKFMCSIFPPIPDFVIPEASEMQDFAPIGTKGDNKSMLATVVEGMGIDPSLVVSTAEIQTMWEELQNQYSIDDLYQKMQGAWGYYEALADESGLAAYNATKSPLLQKTVESLKADARVELSYLLSYHLQQKFIPQSLKDKYLGITKEVQAALRERLGAVDWLSATTRQNAIDKLDNIKLNVAFPDTWHVDCCPALADCKSLAEACHRLKAGNARLLRALLGTDDNFSYLLTTQGLGSNNEIITMDLTLVNAAYHANYNCVTIYPSMLLPPIMPEEGVSEACYYAAFVLIGHEFTHAFDTEGSKYDKYGKSFNWWTVADLMAFQDRKENLIRTYSNLELDPVREPLTFCDGDRTQTENIADLGGFLTVLDAYQARLDAQGFKGENRNEQLRKFYEAYAHVWCVQYGNDKFEILKKTDFHSHARLRVNGVVMNTDLWYDLYNVNRDHKLYLPEDRRAYIW